MDDRGVIVHSLCVGEVITEIHLCLYGYRDAKLMGRLKERARVRVRAREMARMPMRILR